MDQIDLLLEAERRGILPPEQVDLLNEARRRGMVPSIAPQEQKAQEPSLLDALTRQLGLTVRHGLEGAAALPDMIAGPISRAAGAPTFSEWMSSKLPLPRPETDMEKIVGEGSKAIAGAGGLWKALASAPAAVQASQFGRSMLAKPTSQLGSSATGASASELTRQQTQEWDPGASFAAQLAAGVVAPSALSATGNVGMLGVRAGKELLNPLHGKGAEQIAADVLGRTAQDKTAALSNLRTYDALKQLEQKSGKHLVGVPGSKPTAGAVAGDYGLIGGEQIAARGDAAPIFAGRHAENNAARAADLAKLNATEKMLDFYREKRDTITKPLRDAAFNNARGEVNVEPVLDEIFRKMRSSAGQGQATRNALEWLYARVERSKAEGALHPLDMYDGLHKDINDLVKRGIDSSSGRIQLSAVVANDIKKKLADAIEEQAPGFKKYLAHYSRLSKPIDRLEVIAEELGDVGLTKVTSALPAMTPAGAQHIITQAKMRKAANAINEKTKLAPAQSDVLSRVLGDLNAAEVASRGGKQPGSDTYQNIASASFVNRILGKTLAESGAGRAAAKVMGAGYRALGAEDRIQEMIIEAYLDPQKMKKLLERARTSRGSPTLTGLLTETGRLSAGGLLGTGL